ncbi:hypothetical protein CIB84_012862 [Bambusicola thoracicus]|uniref:Ribonuclease A-domain domain-containing protein n=1 Tax=Bambusicola thoracicus TaxID=9083 RepID=A0A2P4SGZ7_BAMTH|nr:hypothetical protein CIB84_012862 [Bambusicola thoracicus]
MAMSSLWWTTILLLALTVSTCYGVPTYQDFLYKHVDNTERNKYTNNAAYCNFMMARPGMHDPRGCKTRNTFVNAPPTALNTLCRNQPNRALRTTQQQLPVTVCDLIRSRPTCTYTGNQFNHRVQVGCWGGLPVHLDGTFP